MSESYRDIQQRPDHYPRLMAIRKRLIDSGMSTQDANTIAVFSQLCFPDAPLNELNIFADGQLETVVGPSYVPTTSEWTEG